jgi:hypothetical protein
LLFVPNCYELVWANVLVSDFAQALSSLWESFECNEFIIAEKISGQVAAVFLEDNGYELHKNGLENHA